MVYTGGGVYQYGPEMFSPKKHQNLSPVLKGEKSVARPYIRIFLENP